MSSRVVALVEHPAAEGDAARVEVETRRRMTAGERRLAPGSRRGRDDGRRRDQLALLWRRRRGGAPERGRRRRQRRGDAPRTRTRAEPAWVAGRRGERRDPRPAARAARAAAGRAAGTPGLDSRSIRRAVAATSIGASRPRSASPRSPSRPARSVRSTSSSSSCERLAAPGPEHRPQLGHRREGDAVVDAVDVAARHREQVAGLAVGVVDRGVEDGDRPQAGRPRRSRARPGRPPRRPGSRAGPCPRRTARRAAPSAGRCPSRWPARPRTPRPRAARACRPGSRPAAARP